jgi:hypothetical protein
VGPTPSGGYPAQRPGTPSGGYPAQRPSTGGFGGGESRTPLIIAIAVVAGILVIILILLATRGGGDNAQGSNDDPTETTTVADTDPATSSGASPGEYSAQDQADFLAGCTEDGTATRSECECVLDYLIENVPVEDAIQWTEEQGGNSEIDGAIEDCRAA